MAEGVVGRTACECLRGSSLGLRGTPGDVGVLAAGECAFRWSGKDEVLSAASAFSVAARECRLEVTLRPSVRGVPGCVRDAAAPIVSIAAGRFVLLVAPSFRSLVLGLGLRAVLVLPETVALRPSFCAGGSASEIRSSMGLGLRACAIASGPACSGKEGRPILANTRLASTVTGSTFSCIRSLLGGSPPPNTILCTLLYILRHVWKAFEAGCGERSWR